MRGYLDAGDKAHNIERDRRETGFVKIVHIEVAQAIVAFEGAEIFEMQIAADQGAGRAKQRVAAGQELEKQRIGAAKEGERVLPQQRELQRQPIEVAPGVLR